jgi:hypothetical protein
MGVAKATPATAMTSNSATPIFKLFMPFPPFEVEVCHLPLPSNYSNGFTTS